MKQLLFISILFLSLSGSAQMNKGWYLANKAVVDSLNELKVGTNDNPTSYTKGFKFHDHGIEYTLLKYVPKFVDRFGVVVYRWYMIMTIGPISQYDWTDDYRIDRILGKEPKISTVNLNDTIQ